MQQVGSRFYTSAIIYCALTAILSPSPASGQLLTGIITGRVRDSAGTPRAGVAVTVTGEHLLGVRTAVTKESGEYRIENLPPGTYAAKFELKGFKAFEWNDIQISAGFVATINVSLEAGDVEETTTITGASPTVDTRSTVQQAVMAQETLEGVPTGRDPWSLAKIVSGRQVSTYDVGGTQGMQQSGISAHGSRSDDKTFAIDGLVVNWPGGGGGSTMVYYDHGMFEEVNHQMSAIPAEVASGGVYMNMVTKSGSNRLKGSIRYYYANEDMQSENFADVTEKYNFPGGNPVKLQYDFNGQAAGPVLRDKIWFFGSYRRWRVDKIWLNSFNPDGTNAIDDNMIWNAAGKITAQLAANHGLAFIYSYNKKNRYHRRATTPAYIDEKATTVQEQPGFTTSAKYTAVLGEDSLFESHIGLMKGTYPELYQPGVEPTDIRREDTVLSTANGAGPYNYENPNYRFQFDNVLTHNVTGWGGSHVFKAGVQFGRQFFQQIYRMNGDMRLIYNNGVANRVMAFNTPVTSTAYIHQLGFFGEDSWTIGNRLTLNLGFRVDRAKGWYPDQASPAGRWVPERRLDETVVYKRTRPAWRMGFTYDVFGDGNTAIKGDFSRYAHQVGIGLVTNVLPLTLSSANIAWTDVNGNDLPDPGELGAFEGFTGAATTRYDNPNGPEWGYSDEVTAGIEHQLMKDFRVSAMYYHRTNRLITGTRNEAVPSTAYTPFTVENAVGQTLTVYNLDPKYLGKQDNVRAAVDSLDTDYDGVELTAAKRFSGRWQVRFGFTAGRNKGGLDQGDFNDPNNLVNQQGIVGDDATYQVKVSGAYVVPKVELNVSGSFIRNTGYPRQYTYPVTRSMYPGLARSTQIVYVNERGDERLPTVMMIDLRFSRRFSLPVGGAIEPQVDLFNITNSDAIVRMVDTVGPRLGYPIEILAPRIIRVGFTVSF